MLTQRKKQNLLHLAVGIVIGIAITALVAYFSAIYSFTKDNIVKIYNVIPSADTVKTVAKLSASYGEEPSTKKSNKTVSDTSVDKSIETFAKKDTVSAEYITIRTDMKIAESIIPIIYYVTDTLNDTKTITSHKGELQVEQWDNPTNFAGYRKMQNKLIVYGIDIDNIALESVDDNLYLIFNNKKLLLKNSDSFLRYPSGFLK